MIFYKTLLFGLLICFAVPFSSYAQEEMTQESWQKQMDDYTAAKSDLTGKLANIEKDIERLKKKKNDCDSIYNQLQSEIYKLVDADKSEVDEFNDRFVSTEKKILNESAPLSDIKEYWFNWISDNKIRFLVRYKSRFDTMKKKVDDWKGE